MRGFSSLAKGVRLLITHVGSAGGVFSKLGVVLGGLSGPVVAVVAVIGTLVAAFMNLWNTNEEFRTAITGHLERHCFQGERFLRPADTADQWAGL